MATSLAVSADGKVLRENFALVVKERCSVQGISLPELATRANLPMARLVGKVGITVPELRRVVSILWPGSEPSEVSELWPFMGSQVIAARAFVMLAEHQAPVNN